MYVWSGGQDLHGWQASGVERSTLSAALGKMPAERTKPVTVSPWPFSNKVPGSLIVQTSCILVNQHIASPAHGERVW